MNFAVGTDWSAVSERLPFPWTSTRRVEATGSTNADLVAAAQAGAAGGTVLVADHQRSGRGRLDRTWSAPPGTSLAISVLLRPPADVGPERWTWLPLLAGLAVSDAIVSLGLADVNLKWPNDVLIGSSKVCGILAERVDGGGEPAVVIGMGINTRLSVEQLPVSTATSLALAGVDVDDLDLVTRVLTRLGAWYQRWLVGTELSPILTERCATIGRRVRLERPTGEAVTGVAVGIDADGRLLLRANDEELAFAAGDVVHLR